MIFILQYSSLSIIVNIYNNLIYLIINSIQKDCTSMYNQPLADSISLIAQLPPKVIVHDMAFDGTYNKIAMACSDKTIKIFVKNNDEWTLESFIKMTGAAAWKVKWTRPEYGHILVACSLDRVISIFQWTLYNKTGKAKFQWSIRNSMVGIGIEDFKFAPGNKFGLSLGMVDCTGTIQVKSIHTSKKNCSDANISNIHKTPACKLGLNCLTWCKKTFDENLIMAVGCKSHETTPLKVLQGFKLKSTETFKIDPINTVMFYMITETNNIHKIEKISSLAIQQRKAVNDISWAMTNGRSYDMIAIATDASVKIYEINISSGWGIQVLNKIDLTQNAGYRICWNILGTSLSISQRKKIKLFKSTTRSVWKQYKQIQEQ